MIPFSDQRGRPARSGHTTGGSFRNRTARLVAGALALALLVTLALPAGAAPLRRLGTNPRSLAMGGTGVSFANDEMALFYNPAGLGAIDNYWFEILPIAIGISGDGKDMVSGGSAPSSEVDDPASLVADNLGKELSARFFIYPNAVFNLQPGVTLGLAAFEDVTLEMRFRNAATPEIEAFYRRDSGSVVGISFPLQNGQMLVGVSLRSLTRTGGEGTISSAALATASSAGSLDLEAELGAATGSGTGYDVGMIWRMETLASMRGQFALVVQNLGGTGLKDDSDTQVGEVPQEVSLGWSFRPQFAVPTLVAFEMRDVLFNLTDDKSTGKRMHFGLEMGFIPQDKSTNLLTLRAGYTAGNPSYGMELSLWHGLTLQYLEYYTEFGEVASEDPRKRSMFAISFGF